ncbi:uncharacterized protein UMAG_03829 [Mycosarcoma maydis]|uniref:Uncharacterized protein n=1 Tax=Mycosarcoma maydis TaxID=5270 RepID=A0A0D1C3F2_MYCMD|nr:uncharacterized protein UMAG_03829 [Ustilago maydis 521]KIS68247.1 hypothetical protein UMAG_03829 [Ustilago maydis 521]|eukprot:XP_011390265.1 hypothetical protein UMAG_03829 [Ustilago maydis 521]
MLATLLSKMLPLAEDPFPPTHSAGSEFEGFFIRLESHSGRSQPTHHQCDPCLSPMSFTSRACLRSSPSHIPRSWSKLDNGEPPCSSPGLLRRRRPRTSSTSSTSSADSSSSGSSAHAPNSPIPASRRVSRDADRTRCEIEPTSTMLTDMDPVLATPDSGVARALQSSQPRQDFMTSLPTWPPGDLILVVCELQSAPVDQRICIYLRWIVHGEEAALHNALYSHTTWSKREEKLPRNASRAPKEGQSFEIVKYIPSWQLKMGARAGCFAVQPFRIDLVDALADAEPELGFLEVTSDGNVVVDLTLLNEERSTDGKKVDTRVRLRSTKFCPWRSRSGIPMGSRGPEGWIQHLGAFLPLHWYVHSSSAPAMFSLEHLAPDSARLELDNAIAAGRGLLHVEKNWGQSFPSGWMWAHAASPLPDPNVRPSYSSTPDSIHLSLAGGSILGLTAFLVGIHIIQDHAEFHWHFAPPTALAPKLHWPSTCASEKVCYGPGLRIKRDFTCKKFVIDLWNLTQWASVEIQGDQHSFATQIPGPRNGAWSPAYCHHSYRCSANVVLRQRHVRNILALPWKVAKHPSSYMSSVKDFWINAAQPTQTACDLLGWNKVAEVRLHDRVALEFGGDFAQ